MTDTPSNPDALDPFAEPELLVPRPPRDFRLLRRVLGYHLALAIVIVTTALIFPEFIDEMPIGGVTELAEDGEITVSQVQGPPTPAEDFEIVETIFRATSELDRLGYARQLMLVIAGVWLLMLPVSWVHKGIHRLSTYDHSLDETTLILPGIVAGVHFRRALQDTFDALFILVAIGTGIAGGVAALEIATILTVFFCYATLYVYYMGNGLESHFAAQRKALKRARKEAQAASEQPPDS
jgi:hypothetical protein